MVQFGIDNLLLQNPIWKKQRLALLTNHAATTNQLQTSRQALLGHGFNITQLFSPEHGLDIKGADGAEMNDGIDPLTNLPTISLYSHKLAPSVEDLEDVDMVLFDVPDIGCRFYTYLWSMTHLLEACAKHEKQLIILDRPNPISGLLSMNEGPMLNEEYCSSFIGRWQIPLRHNCTMGELALYFNQAKNIHAKLEVIKCTNWQKEMMHPDWDIDFVPTSPAMRSFEAALLYPGLGLLEATNISEGRGTESPFQIAGAPWMNGNNVAAAFNHFGIDNIKLLPITFTPTESKYANETCNGVQFRVTDFSSYLPVFTGLLFIKLVKDLYPKNFAWNPYPTNVNPTGKSHLDKLLGIPNSEALFELNMLPFLQKVEQLTKLPYWKKEIESYLLYR